MIHLISFTTLFGAIVRGDLKVSDLLRSDVRIHFGCSMTHLFGTNPGDMTLAPYEVGWSNTRLQRTRFDGCDDEHYRVRADKVDPEVWIIWLQFRRAILQAMEENRVMWQCGNYPALVEDLEEQGEIAFQMGLHRGERWSAIFGD